MRVDDDFSVDSRSQQQNSSVFFSAVSFVLALQSKMITTRNGFFNLPDGFSIKMPSEAGGWCGLLCWSLQPTAEQLFLTRTSSVMLAGQVRKKKKKADLCKGRSQAMDGDSHIGKGVISHRLLF